MWCNQAEPTNKTTNGKVPSGSPNVPDRAAISTRTQFAFLMKKGLCEEQLFEPRLGSIRINIKNKLKAKSTVYFKSQTELPWKLVHPR